MTDVMIDLETLGTTPDSAIIAIGAVAFDRVRGTILKEFYRRISWKSAMKRRRVCADTVRWWIGQNEQARKEICRQDNVSNMDIALGELSIYFSEFSIERTKVWGNGATFDISMLENAFTQYKMVVPWKFWNVRDCRTVEDLTAGVMSKRTFTRDGTAHHALEDAKYQARYISAMINALKKNL